MAFDAFGVFSMDTNPQIIRTHPVPVKMDAALASRRTPRAKCPKFQQLSCISRCFAKVCSLQFCKLLSKFAINCYNLSK